MKLIFLDIDGVLNAHELLPSGYCGICRERVGRLNTILRRVPDALLVISSAWRYLMLNGDMTLRGFEVLLLVHGVECKDRLHGHTTADGTGEMLSHFDTEAWKSAGLRWRASQIAEYVAKHDPQRFVVLDDLPLDVPNLVQTDGDEGLQDFHVDEVLRLLVTESVDAA